MRILNLGCGDDAYGTDFVDVYPTRKGVRRFDIESGKLPYANDIFDEVYMKCVFEHLKNPGTLLKETRRILKKGGRAVIITDNAGCWVWHVPFCSTYSKQHYDNAVRHGSSDRHYGMFTPLHMKNHLQTAGFRSARVDYTWLEDRTKGFVNKTLFVLLSVTARMASIFLGRKMGYPHLKAVGIK